MKTAPSVSYVQADHLSARFRNIFRNHFDRFCDVWDERFGKRYGYYRKWAEHTVREFLKCLDPTHGFAHLECPDCETRRLVPFTCKRKLCLTCGEKRKHAWTMTSAIIICSTLKR